MALCVEPGYPISTAGMTASGAERTPTFEIGCFRFAP